jgi:DNA-binding CsgD family transcriptional regulator
LSLMPPPIDAHAVPEVRHDGAAGWARCLALMIDEVDYGVLLLDPQGNVRLINRSARRELDERHPLHLVSGQLHARGRQDTLALHGALSGAVRCAQRELLWLGQGSARVSVAVLPLGAQALGGGPATMLLLGRRQVAEGLSVAGFARSHGLTPAETRVLEALCAGVPPAKIAEGQGVRISTVRSQISSLRDKTSARSIRALVRMVSVLPPVVPAALGGQGEGHGGHTGHSGHSGRNALDTLLEGLLPR